jgi:micrococcal nuclease
MNQYNINIVKVIDGDTVDVNINLGFDIILQKKRIRLYGIDAPEARTTNLDEKEFGLFVKQKVIDFLSNKFENIKLKVFDDNDKFGRILGDIYCDNNSLCEYLLNNNYVVKYNGQNKNNIKYLHLENKQKLNI